MSFVTGLLREAWAEPGNEHSEKIPLVATGNAGFPIVPGTTEAHNALHATTRGRSVCVKGNVYVDEAGYQCVEMEAMTGFAHYSDQ